MTKVVNGELKGTTNGHLHQYVLEGAASTIYFDCFQVDHKVAWWDLGGRNGHADPWHNACVPPVSGHNQIRQQQPPHTTW
jgi:hypothetical protein